MLPSLLLSAAAALPATASAKAAPVAETLSIGLIVPLTTNLDECSIREFISSRKLPVTVTLYDSQNDPVKAAGEAAKAVKAGHDLVVVGNTSQEAIAAGAVTNAARVPMIAPTASHPQVTEGRPFVARIVPSQPVMATLYFEFVQREFKPRKIAIIKNLSVPYSTNYADMMLRNFERVGQKSRTRVFEIIDGYSGFAQLTSEIASGGFELVYAPVYNADALELLRTLALAKVRAPFLIHNPVQAEILPKDSPPVYYNKPVNPRAARALLAEFDQFTRTPKCAHVRVPPGISDVANFHLMKNLETLVRTNPTLRGKELLEALVQSKGPTLFGEGQGTWPAYFFVTEGDKHRFVRQVSP